MRAVKRSFAITLAFAIALCFTTACSSPDNKPSSSAGVEKTQTASSESFVYEAPCYDTEYFLVELPPSWGDAWSVDIGQEYRASMDATNYSYTFLFDDAPQFTIECKLFSLNADAMIGFTGTRQVEFYASGDISPEDEFYVRGHIEVKQDASTSEMPAEATESSSTSSKSSYSENEADMLSGPVEDGMEALNRVHDSLMRAGKEIPPKIEFDHMDDSGRYVIHGYEVVNDGGGMSHNATWFWYSVGKDGSIYDEIMMREIDPITMEAVGLSTVPDNDYYTLTLPAELATADIMYEEGKFGGPTTVGAITSVVMDGLLQFEVVVLSDDWGPQGDMAIVKIGTPSTDSSSVVFLTVPVGPVDGEERDPEAAQAKAKEYASYVSLR